MDCTDLRAILSGFVDGELDAAVRHDAERHLVDCASCQARVARAESLDAMLREAASRWGREEALPGQVVEHILSQTVADVRAFRSVRRVALAGWLATAASLGLATLLWFTGHRGGADPTAGDTGALATDSPPRDGPSRGSSGASARAPRDGGASSREAGLASRVGSHAVGDLGGESGTPAVLESTLPILAQDGPEDAPGALASADHQDDIESASVEREGESEASLAMHGPPTWRSLLNEDGRSTETESDPDLDRRFEKEAFSEDVQDGVDALFAAARLLRHIRMTGTATVLDSGQVQARLAYDRLVDRLEAADSLLGEGDSHRAVRAAAAMLHRLQHRPFDADELHEMQLDLGRIPLPERLEAIAEQLEGRTPA